PHHRPLRRPKITREPLTTSQRNSLFRLWLPMKRFIVPLFALAASTPITQAGDKLEYNRDVRPILAENCFPCHGPDSAARKAGLRLDQREAAIKAGAIAPKEPDDSEMIRRIFADDVKERMPPAKTNKKLTPEQKEKLKG